MNPFAEDIRMFTEQDLVQYRGKQFMVLLEQARQIKVLESNNESKKLNYHSERLKKILKRNFNFKEVQIEELLQDLKVSFEQFETCLNVVMKHRGENSQLHKNLDHELSLVHKKLLEEPYNFEPEGLDEAVKMAFIQCVFVACKDDDNFAKIFELYNQFKIQIMGLPGGLMSIPNDDIGKLCAKVSNKYKTEPRLGEYIVQLACNLPFVYNRVY